MLYPNFKNKQGCSSVVTARQYIDYVKKLHKFDLVIAPQSVIICYSNRLYKYIMEIHTKRRVSTPAGEMLLLDVEGDIAVVGGFGIGAPVAIAKLEEMIAFGVKQFLSIGEAGALQHELAIGDIVLCERAIRDEGTSHHYLASAKYAYPSKVITAQIANTLEQMGHEYTRGTSWTVDALYRETFDEVKRYQVEGVKTVEMEASALFVVAKYHSVELGAFFCVSDSLADFSWRPEFHSGENRDGLETLYEIAVKTLRGR
ncbi:MAG: nucleoside phosphorylase [Negativicutes bacterium]|jgi:uridine phosphorylase